MKKLIILFSTICLLLLMVIPCFASPWQIRGGDEEIEKGRVIEGDLLFSGDRLEINGDIKGDVVVWASQVIINGRVEGSILGFILDKLTINGVIQGNIRGFATNIKINGQVNGKMTIAAIALNTNPKSLVEQGILAICSRLDLGGTVNGPVDVNSVPIIKIGGRINSDLKTQGAPITWQAPVEISGTVNDYSGIASDPAKIKGVTIGKGYHLHQENTNNSQFSWGITLFAIIWFIGSLLATLILFRLFPRTFWIMTEPTPLHFRRNFLIGLISFIGIPLVVLILFISGVGIPLAILLGLVYLILILFSGIPLNLWFGRLVFKSRLHPTWMIILGGLLMMLINFIPMVNLIMSLVFMWLGFGMLIGNLRPEYSESRNLDMKA